jgi:hypothetical protein
MVSDNNNHPQATRCLLSGKIFPGRPRVGSWISYALGTEKQNLPAYVVLRDPNGYNNGGTTMWERGWLPAIFQGTEIQSRGAAVLDLHPSAALPEGIQRNSLRALARLNEERRKLYDLKMRGLLETTIVLWTGEFGRLPISQKGDGRDHNRNAFSLLLAGGGFKAGHVHGRTDEFSYKTVDGEVSCPDLLATILHQLGIDHDRLKYQHHGREESLTGSPVTHARVVHEIIES